MRHHKVILVLSILFILPTYLLSQVFTGTVKGKFYHIDGSLGNVENKNISGGLSKGDTLYIE
jgi:hypothetical protein